MLVFILSKLLYEVIKMECAQKDNIFYNLIKICKSNILFWIMQIIR